MVAQQRSAMPKGPGSQPNGLTTVQLQFHCSSAATNLQSDSICSTRNAVTTTQVAQLAATDNHPMDHGKSEVWDSQIPTAVQLLQFQLQFMSRSFHPGPADAPESLEWWLWVWGVSVRFQLTCSSPREWRLGTRLHNGRRPINHPADNGAIMNGSVINAPRAAVDALLLERESDRLLEKE
ncbi:LysM domain-containing GPI-anchored protein 2, partial [Frankliniella fusca]